MTRPDAVVIGGGHNGLACAGLLAKAGLKVMVLEASDTPGGMARGSVIAEDFQVPEFAHLLYLLDPELESQLELARHGLSFAAPDLPTVALSRGRPPLVLPSDPAKAEGLSASDLSAWTELRQRLLRFAQTLAPFRKKIPPRLGTKSRADWQFLAGLGWKLRSLGRDDMREFLRVILMNVADVAEDELEDPLLQAAVAFDGVLGTAYGPRAPGTVLTLLYRMAGSVADRQGAVALPKGGMGAVGTAFARAAEAAGATLRCHAPVQQIQVEDSRVAGVVLGDGERIETGLVVSSLDPKRTFLDLIGAPHLDTGFIRHIRNIRARGAAAKLNLALDGLPEAPGLERRHLAGRMVIAPSIAAIERAADAVKYGRHSEATVIEAIIPSLTDPELAPVGQHILSAIVQYAPPAAEGGTTAALRQRFAELAMARLNEVMPGIHSLVRAQEMLLPEDIQLRTGASGGHWHHGELAFDQMLMLRPVPGAHQYETPIASLYLCGAGCHPGGGVMGAAAMNAARVILAREGRV